MKTIKLYTGLFIAICISILTGCNDSSVSPTYTASADRHISNQESNLQEVRFSCKYKLNPGETLYLNYNNTGIMLINSYEISNCGMVRTELLIRTSNMIGTNSLPCIWEKHGSFAFEDLSIKNISSRAKSIEVKLSGTSVN